MVIDINTQTHYFRFPEATLIYFSKALWKEKFATDCNNYNGDDDDSKVQCINVPN